MAWRDRGERQDLRLCFAAAAGSGALLCAAHGWWPAAAVLAPAPLLAALCHSSPRQAFYQGLLCGLIESLVLLGVIGAGAELWLALALLYGLQRALFSTLVTALRLAPSLWPLVCAATWEVLEWVHAALPMSLPNLLGDTQHTGPLLAVARLGGTYLISFLLVWVAGSAAVALVDTRGSIRAAATALCKLTAPSAAVLGLAVVAGHALRPATGPSVSVASVQGALTPRAYEMDAGGHATLATYVHLTEAAPASALTVWPETAVWQIWAPQAEINVELHRLQAARGGVLLAGVIRRDAHGHLRNSAIALDGGAIVVTDKTRLALRVESGFEPGDEPVVLPARGLHIGVVFCLESVTPATSRQLTRQGASLLVVLADGSRFADSVVERMHAQRSVLRAVESGRSVVHAGQHGRSALVDPDGTVSARLPALRSGVLHGQVALVHDTMTPFARLGPWTTPLGVAIILAATVARCRARAGRREQTGSPGGSR